MFLLKHAYSSVSLFFLQEFEGNCFKIDAQGLVTISVLASPFLQGAAPALVRVTPCPFSLFVATPCPL
jgi:hypothetical protein